MANLASPLDASVLGAGKNFNDYQTETQQRQLQNAMIAAQINSQVQNAQRQQALLEETVRSNKAKEYNEGGGMLGNPYLNTPDSGGAGAPSPVTAFAPSKLESYPAQMQPLIKGIIEGRIAPTRQALGVNPQLYISAATSIDPTFDATNYNARAKTYQDFTSGKSRQNITSIETALNTLAQVKEADKIGGTDNAGILNQPINYLNAVYQGSRNNPDLNTYNTKAKAAADEVTKAIVPGGGTEADRQKREGTLKAAQSPKSRAAGSQALIDELSARLEPLVQSYNQGMGTSKNGIDLLSPGAVEAYNKVMGKAPSNTHATGVKVIQDATPIDGNEIPSAPPINPLMNPEALSVTGANYTVGKVYTNPAGQKAVWDGQSFKVVQ